MENIILKTPDKRILYFYRNNGICVKNLLSPAENPKMIFDDAVCDFDAITTENGDAGIICQDKDGSIIFLKENDNNYLKSTLLKNKSHSAYNKNFRLHRHGKWINVLYVIEYEEKNILSFQIVDRENQVPEAVDEIDGSFFYSFTDRFGNIFIIYNTKNSCGYRIYNWGRKEWSQYVKIGNGKFITGIKNNEDDCIAVMKENGKYFFVNLICKDGYSSHVFPAEILSDESNPRLIIEKDILWLIIRKSEIICGIKISDNFEINSESFIFGNDNEKKEYRIKTNEENYIIEDCFGYEKELIPKIIIYKDLFDTSKIIEPATEITAENEINSIKTQYELKEESFYSELNDLRKENEKLINRIEILESKINGNTKI